MPPTAQNSLTKNDPVFRKVLDWITGTGSTHPRLEGYSWLQDRWHAIPEADGHMPRACCVATASILIDGGHVIPPQRRHVMQWTETRAYLAEGDQPRAVADVARQVLGLEGPEAAIVFSARRTARQLLALAPCFRDNTPITPTSIIINTPEELTLAWADWLNPPY